MSFYSALLAWLVIAAILIAAVVVAVKGSVVLMVLTLGVFFVLFAKYGCAAH
jgi:hypothetical protein